MNRIYIIIKAISTIDGKINHYKLNKLKTEYPNCYNYLLNFYTDSSCIDETINRIKYNITIRPTCEYCGKPVKWQGKDKYAAHCCTRCSTLDKNVQQKLKQTCLERYGVEYATKTDIQKEKSKQTCLKKYGAEYFTQTDIQKEKSKQTKLKLYNSSTYNNINKSKETKLNKYGDENYNNRDKAKETCKQKYGVINPYCIENIKNKAISKESQYKKYITKRHNGTINSSSTEDILYIKLIKKYPDVVRQYTDERYPFSCDFYIPSKDLFIEFQGGHFHQYHPFDKTNISDVNLLNKYILKQDLPQYKQIINIWTKRDPLKRQTAKENNLNFLEIWPNYNIEDIIKKIEEF